jgi:hypothetical protein
MMNRLRRTASIAVILSITSTFAGSGARPAFAQESQQDLAKKVVNPLTDMVSVPLQFNWLNDLGPDHELRSVIYFQPVVPISIGERWNLIGRWMMPYLSQPVAYGGSSGLGDIMAQAFFSPKASGTFTWGAGPMFNLPTTTDPTLGYGKWAVGPAVAVMKQQGPMTYGMLVNNIWSFASASAKERANVNLGYFQPVIAHTSRNGVTVLMSTEAIADWEAEDSDDRWSVPINLLVSKLTRFGATPMSVQVGGGYYVVKPSHGPDWQLRTTFTLLFPRR